MKASERQCRLCKEVNTEEEAVRMAKNVAIRSLESLPTGTWNLLSLPRHGHPNGYLDYRAHPECPICLKMIRGSNEVITRLPCGHVACKTCLSQVAGDANLALNLRNCRCSLCNAHFNIERLCVPKDFRKPPAEVARPPAAEAKGASAPEQDRAAHAAPAQPQKGDEDPKGVRADEQPDYPIGVGDFVRVVGEAPQGGTSVSGQDPWTFIQRVIKGREGVVDQWDPATGRYTVILDKPLGGGDGGDGASIHIISVGVLPKDLVRFKLSPPPFPLCNRHFTHFLAWTSPSFQRTRGDSHAC